jgi:cyclase
VTYETVNCKRFCGDRTQRRQSRVRHYFGWHRFDRHPAQAQRRYAVEGGDRPARPLRYIINTEPHGDHWTGNAFFNVPVVAQHGVRSRILGTDLAAHVARVASFGPEEPKLLENYKPNAPVITFQNEMTLHVGNHTFHMVHMPGHTAYQAAVIVEEEGVVFTSDNIFCRVQTWLQEANPDHWLQALELLGALREEIFVPDHGPVCDKRYLNEQGSFVREWVEVVRGGIERGMNKEECVAISR